jgi:hypothetical protein
MNTTRITKKRLVLPHINNVISRLVEMSKDAANLEYNDNWESVRRLKRDLMNLREGEFKQLYQYIDSIREEIATNKYNQKQKRKDDTDKKELEQGFRIERKSVEATDDGKEWLQDE